MIGIHLDEPARDFSATEGTAWVTVARGPLVFLTWSEGTACHAGFESPRPGIYWIQTAHTYLINVLS